jgi:hypothetical protein
MQFRFIYKFLATILDLLPEIYDNNLLHLHKIFTKIFFVIDELYLWMDVNIFHQKFSSLKVKKTEFVK